MRPARVKHPRCGQSARVHRVAFVIDTLGTGGAERHLVRLIRGLTRTGHWDASVYCLDRSGNLIADVEALGVPVYGPAARWARTPSGVAATLVDLRRFLRRERPEIAHCYLNAGGLVGAAAARAAGVPYVITTRRSVHDFAGSKRFVYRVGAAIMDRLSDAVIAVSEAARQQAIAEGTPDARIVTVRNAVEPAPEKLRPAKLPGSPVIASVGSLREVKGQRYLVEALPRILAQAPSARLVLVGSGPDRESLEEMAATLRVRHALEFLGERSDVWEILAGSDIFVLPSVVEGLPNALLEAMAVGIPVVATRVGGVPEVVHDFETGLLVEPASPEALAAAILTFARDARLSRRCARAANALVLERYNPDVELRGVLCTYEALLTRTFPAADIGAVQPAR